MSHISNRGGSSGSSFTSTATAYNTPVTFSAALGTVTNDFIASYRMGEYLYLRGSFNLGTVSSADAYLVLANGLTVDTSFYTDMQDRVGEYAQIEATGTPRTMYTAGGFDGVLSIDTADNDRLYFSFATVSDQFQKANAAAAFITNNYITINAQVKISGWTTNN
jgi:hypothetical protein